MRIEPFSVGSFIHVIKRGARGINIVQDESDRWRFLRSLYFMNEKYIDWNWHKVIKGQKLFARPETWPIREPLVHILCYTLMPNHVHLLLKEIKEGGVSLFMKKLGQSMTEHANKKYREKGSIFQGSYRSRTIDTDEYLQRVAAYIMVKNTLELYPKGGLAGAQKDFDDAWKWCVNYPFSSLADYTGNRRASPILTKELLGELFNSSQTFKTFVRDILQSGAWTTAEFE